MNEVYKEKLGLVQRFEIFLKLDFPDIESMTYKVNDPETGVDEVVEIKWKSGGRRVVNVTANSKAAILIAVINAIC